ncbi:MAG: 50S ribosome-binding GTPase, partial [Kiritimatiellae bacterium]|nr:50S ribosome-binding GTPase [Kiritimatiellia bacterium]
MAEMHETPSANRLRIAFFGPRNAGKSTLVNAFTGQDVAIVSDVPGTTTDPVSKAMEIPPLGPCLVTDTAGLDDEGELGAMRVRRTLEVLAVADVAVWVEGADPDACSALRERFLAECRRNGTAAIVHRRGDGVDELMRKVAAAKVTERERGLLDGIVRDGERLVLVCPIDSSAPKGRLILPQVQLIRECLDRHLACVVCQPEEL